MEENKYNDREEIFSQKVRAGKRTYFFDVKATKSNDYYLTITESKRKFKEDGFFYEKHKIFLYKEDFNKFVKALNESVDHVKNELLPEVDFAEFDRRDEERSQNYAANAEANSNTNTNTDTDTKTDKDSGSDTELSWD